MATASAAAIAARRSLVPGVGREETGGGIPRAAGPRPGGAPDNRRPPPEGAAAFSSRVASFSRQRPPLSQNTPAPTKAAELRIPFEQFTCKDAFGRTITPYLPRPPRGADKPLPLILFVSGSGCQSVWMPHEGQVNSGLQGLLYQLAKGRARV